MFETKYIIMQTIGRNSQKMTSIVKNKSNKYFIAKKVPINDEQTMREIELMNSLSHPNIIALHEIIEEQKWAYIIEEYCEEGDLQYYLKRQIKLKKLLQEELVARWLLQILLAMEYLHHLKIIHRDIRPKNIFLTANGNIKLGSFKVSKVLEEEGNYAQTLINSPYYLTPQLTQGRAYDYKVDIWAFGCVLYEICSLKPPINLSNLGQILSKITKGKVQDLPFNYSKQLNFLYQKCMKRNPNERYSARQMLKTAYFLQVMQKFIVDKGKNVNLQQKIPIKRYNIHLNKYEKMKIKKKLIRDKLPTQRKDNMFPKLEVQSNKVDKKNSSKQKKSKQKKNNIQTPIIKRASREKQQSQIYQKSYSSDKKNSKTQHSNKELKMPKPNTGLQQQKKLILAPPLLPKPLKTKQKVDSQRRAKTKISQLQGSQNFEMTMSKQQLNKQLNNFQKKQIRQINEGLTKIFQNLNIREDDDQQVEFDFEEEQSELRLTNPHDQAASLVDTYKSKLGQLIEEINFKYCPNMQPIPEKTTEFDSSSFSKPLTSFLSSNFK